MSNGSGLGRLPDETCNEHRAMLLYGAQCKTRRSLAAVGRIVGITAVRVRSQRDRMGWLGRLRPHEPAQAIVVYRQLYGEEYGMLELRQLGDRIQGNIWAEPTADQTALAKDAANTAALASARMRAVRVEEEKSRAGEFLGLIDDAVLQLRADMDDPNKITRIGIRDITGLVKASEMLGDRLAYLDGEKQKTDQIEILESVRVRLARARGNDVLQAVLMDVQEIAMLLDHMLTPAPNTTADITAANESLPALPVEFDDIEDVEEIGDGWGEE